MRNILGHVVMEHTARERVLRAQQEPVAQAFCCDPCSRGQHDRCLSDQPCDCQGCMREQQTQAHVTSAATTSGLPSHGALRERGRQGML